MSELLPKNRESASQTCGPYVHIGCTPVFAGLVGAFGGDDLGRRMTNRHTLGERIRISGRILDGNGDPVTDGLIEIWQADHAGLFAAPGETRGQADPNFSGWGRQPTDHESGAYEFNTIRPGPVPIADGTLQAPHIQFFVVARGINLGLHTRMYFPDEAPANARDPVFQLIEDPARREVLLGRGAGGVYRFDIHLQGASETIFFDV